jgi:hypothetical protein
MASRLGTLRAAVLGDSGASGLLRRVLLLLLGGFLLEFSAANLREAVRWAPVELDCEDWLEAPGTARWVSLTGCRLDLAMAARRNLKGFFAQADGGRVRGRTLELFLPVASSPEHEAPPRAVVSTGDPVLLGTVDELGALPVEQVDAFIEAHREVLISRLKPERLTGYVEPVVPWSAREALRSLDAPGAVVLDQGREPERANALFGLVVALALLAVACWGPAARLWAARRDGAQVGGGEA